MIPFCGVGDDLVKERFEALVLRTDGGLPVRTYRVESVTLRTFKIVGMNTEFAFDRHKKVDLGLAFAFAFETARFIAGCCVLVRTNSDFHELMLHTKGMILSVLSISSLV